MIPIQIPARFQGYPKGWFWFQHDVFLTPIQAFPEFGDSDSNYDSGNIYANRSPLPNGISYTNIVTAGRALWSNPALQEIVPTELVLDVLCKMLFC